MKLIYKTKVILFDKVLLKPPDLLSKNNSNIIKILKHANERM